MGEASVSSAFRRSPALQRGFALDGGDISHSLYLLPTGLVWGEQAAAAIIDTEMGQSELLSELESLAYWDFGAIDADQQGYERDVDAAKAVLRKSKSVIVHESKDTTTGATP